MKRLCICTALLAAFTLALTPMASGAGAGTVSMDVVVVGDMENTTMRFILEAQGERGTLGKNSYRPASGTYEIGYWDVEADDWYSGWPEVGAASNIVVDRREAWFDIEAGTEFHIVDGGKGYTEDALETMGDWDWVPIALLDGDIKVR